MSDPSGPTGLPTGLDAARRLMAFIDAAPSPFHACAEAAGRLEAAGFRRLEEVDAWPDSPGACFMQRGGSLVAWATGPHHGPTAGFRIVGAHTDSPNLRVKPNADAGAAGFRQVAVEVYGGALLNSWLDRDLGISGRVVVRGPAGPEERLLRIDEPLLRVPQLAIHLDREISTKGLLLNPQQHLSPIWGVGDRQPGAFSAMVGEHLGVAPDAVLAWDLMTHDLTPSTLAGADQALLSAPRLDNLCSSWAGVEAIAHVAATGQTPQIPVLVLFDHEEVGSSSDRGADSTLLPAVVERLVLGLGGGREEVLRALAASVCCSADNAHATHPNYPDRHEPGHQIAVNGGPVLKVNSSMRYATDAASAAAFVEACEQASVPYQRYAHRSDLPCGSTIGPITATRLGIPTFDVGVAQLAMHSARELCGSADPAHYTAAMAAFLAPATP
ncbi:MAG TPA: M18 family aminopeptidase [Acidimicrobiales bacterium]|nr:M18 family aminopeptidase [Acidimicrobiales bacterium]